MLDDIKTEGGRDRLLQFISPEVTESIEYYSSLPDPEYVDPLSPVAATPAALGAAALGGATAAVVEYAYDKYVGNRSLPILGIDDDEFNLIRKRHYPKYLGSPNPAEVIVSPALFAYQTAGGGGYPTGKYKKDDGEMQMWGMAVGTAAAGALGYKVAEHSLREHGAAVPQAYDTSESQFNLPK